MESLLWYLIVGLIAGGLARLLVPGRDPIGLLGTLVLGLAGAFIGGFVVRALSGDPSVGIIGATIGAIVVLLAYKAVAGRNAGRTTAT